MTLTRGFKQYGASCREFITVVTTKGRKETVIDRARPSGAGTWQIVS